MCLQYTDFSRIVIGSFVPVLSDGSLKERSPSAFKTFIQSCSSPLRSAGPRRMRSCRRADGQRRAGGDGMKHAKEFLADHYLTHRLGKAISAATDSYFSPAPAFYHSKIFICNRNRDIQRAEDVGRDYQKYTARIKSDSTYTLCIIWITTVYCIL